MAFCDVYCYLIFVKKNVNKKCQVKLVKILQFKVKL